MEIDSSALKLELGRLLTEYYKAVDAAQERAAHGWLRKIELLVPNADFNDLMFYGELERTNEELIEEAVKREAIYHKRGIVELMQYIRELMKEAMDRANPDSLDYRNASSKFEKINRKLSKIH